MALLPAGMNVVVVPAPKPVRRTWRERLLSRPWRPLQAFRTVAHPMWDLMDGTQCYRVGNTLYVDERQFSELKKQTIPGPSMSGFGFAR